jgi:hypothetical protein
MNTNILNFIITLLLALTLSIFLPWWSVMLAAFVSAVLFSLNGWKVFFIPFVAVFLFWTGYAFLLSNDNNFTLAKKIAILLPLDGNPYLLILVTGIMGGFAAGIAGIFGKQCRVLAKK